MCGICRFSDDSDIEHPSGWLDGLPGLALFMCLASQRWQGHMNGFNSVGSATANIRADLARTTIISS